MSQWTPPPQAQFAPKSPDLNMETPSAVTYYRIYAGVLAVIYAALVIAGIGMLVASPSMSGKDQLEFIVYGVVFVVMGVPLAIASVVSMFLPQRKWAWFMHVIMAAMGTSSCCFAPFAIFIIIKYLEPDVKRYFGV